ncbi:MAG: TIR domain-containing protein [Sphingopyxis sp.]|nr:TIR domain-containing protein [Sphingopyxis sp.]
MSDAQDPHTTGRDGSGPCDVFLSYSREDQKRAMPIIAAIEAAGFTLWWDGKLAGGERFLPATESALENARAVVVLWSARSVNSHWVRDEATRGRDRNCIIPVSIDGTEAPLGFRQFQTINFSQWKGRTDAPEFLRLTAALARLCDRASDPAVPATTRTAMPNRRALLIGGAAVAVIGAGGVGAWMGGLFGSGSTTNSVAVLPFENMSGDGRDYFAQGLSAELRAALARNMALKVAAQTSSEAAGEMESDAKSIARRLDVAFLLDGNVRIAGDSVRIAAELIDGASGLVQWTKSFDRPMADVLAVQAEIASAVMAALTSVIGDSGSGEAPLGGTTNIAAYDAYLRGRDLYNNATDEAGERAALSQFETAIALDPRFAGAHAARARSLTVIANQYGSLEETRRYYDAALIAAERAVELAPDYPDAQSTLGAVLFQARLEVARARAPYDKSYRLGPGDATVIGRFALYCANTGRDAEALSAATRAMELDPLNPLTRFALGYVHYAARRYPQAIAEIEAGLAQNPELGSSNATMASALFLLGDLDRARAAFMAESNPLYRETGLAIVEHRAGRMDAAATARRNVETGLGIGQLTLYQQAQIAAQWGEIEAAARLLGEARAAVDSGLIYLKVDPMLDPVRQHPDVIRLHSALGFS